MVRSIHILRTSAPPFKDHWGLWLPSSKVENIGTVIEVQGGVHSGFEHDITRNYNHAASNRPSRLTFLGTVDDVHVLDPPDCDGDGGAEVHDTQARDEIERCALSIPPPGPSMNSAERNVPAYRTEFSDCQWWIAQVVEKLVLAGILDKSAVTKLRVIPKN